MINDSREDKKDQKNNKNIHFMDIKDLNVTFLKEKEERMKNI